ncbi:MAG: hypothetical protein ACR650_11260 [Methylocystis sp.]
MQEQLIVELLRMFIRLRQSQFRQMSATLDDESPGWRRGHGERPQWLIPPPVWREIFEPHGIDPVEAARIVNDFRLLHAQSNDTLQCVVMVGRPKKSVRAYVVDGAALAAWKPPTPMEYRSYRGAGARQQESDMAALLSPALGAFPDPANLSAMLEHGVALALQKGMEVLSMSLDPADRQSASLLRSQTAFAGHLINAQVRVDEAKLRQRRANAIERLTRLVEEERARQRELGY